MKENEMRFGNINIIEVSLSQDVTAGFLRDSAAMPTRASKKT